MGYNSGALFRYDEGKVMLGAPRHWPAIIG